MRPINFTITAEPLGDRRVKVIASTADVDSEGTRLLPRGCDTAAFRKNPIVLWGHRRDGDPDDAIGTVVDLQITDRAVVAVVQFDDEPKALACLRKVRKGIIRSVSVGMIPIEQTEPDDQGVVTITRWELRELSFCHVPANPNALVVRGFRIDANVLAKCAQRSAAPTYPKQMGTSPTTVSRSTEKMNEIMQKLGLKEGATSDEIVAALIKYVKESQDSDADKAATIGALLGSLTPAPSSDTSDGLKAAAAEAMADEVRKLQSRVAELEDQNKTATAAAEPTPEQRADAAIKDGRWPIGQRAALVEQYKNTKTPFLFAAKSFSTRSLTFTRGGNPASSGATTPNFGGDADGETKTAAKSILGRVEAHLKALKQ